MRRLLLFSILALALALPSRGVAATSSVPRVEFLRDLALVRGFAPSPGATATCFSDVVATDEDATFLCTAKAGAWVRGYNDGAFRPTAPVTRAEAAVMIANLFTTCPLRHRTTTADIAHHAERDRIEIALSHEWLMQRGGRFEPAQSLTQSEALQALSQLARAVADSNPDASSCYLQ
ncbi:MAG: S-layer homology domain-containing protein [Acidobacteria bacterium]|nr:S-layer homology domain-containing protein [Acidobacteriota bacterium]MBV9477357.1 S-layer homology domain-containing protein [Acidobacteriota bacterium]